MARARTHASEWSARRTHGPERREVKHAVEYAARAGYLVKGLIYGTIGVLAAMTAFGFAGGSIVGPRSAIETLRSQPFGQVILWIVAIGLVGYVVWRLVEAFADPEHRGSDAKALADVLRSPSAASRTARSRSSRSACSVSAHRAAPGAAAMARARNPPRR